VTLIAVFRPVMRQRGALLFVPVMACLLVATVFWRRPHADTSLVAVVRRGALTAELTTSGTLRPIASITYRSPLAGREAQIVEIVPEGTRVNEGDLLVRLDTTELQRDVDRGQQELRQAQTDLRTAEAERLDAEATVKAVSEGEGALTVEEARTRLQLAQNKANRLRQEYDQLKPLMDKGFITRDELAKTADALEQADEELALARKRTDVVVRLTHPREKQRAAVQLAQKGSQLENVNARVQEAQARLQMLRELVENCTIYARRPGMVVYEEVLNASPRRKIRVGDRVGTSQGLVTTPEVNRMLVEASVGEAEVHRVRPGQTALVRLEAFPNLRLTGKVIRVGTLASSSIDRPLDEKRFDLVVELDPTEAELRPEMTARADIVTGNRDGVLLVPVNAVFDQQGTYVAHVAGLSGIETRPVELGESNDRVVEVLAGLREGERVLLNEPETAAAAPEAAARGENGERGNVLQPR